MLIFSQLAGLLDIPQDFVELFNTQRLVAVHRRITTGSVDFRIDLTLDKQSSKVWHNPKRIFIESGWRGC
mgnify:CR=1 FL=1